MLFKTVVVLIGVVLYYPGHQHIKQSDLLASQITYSQSGPLEYSNENIRFWYSASLWEV